MVAELIAMVNTGNMHMRATFSGVKPTLEDVYSAQCTQGYKANGFPQGVKIERIPDPSGVASDPVYTVTFKLQQGKDH